MSIDLAPYCLEDVDFYKLFDVSIAPEKAELQQLLESRKIAIITAGDTKLHEQVNNAERYFQDNGWQWPQRQDSEAEPLSSDPSVIQAAHPFAVRDASPQTSVQKDQGRARATKIKQTKVSCCFGCGARVKDIKRHQEQPHFGCRLCSTITAAKHRHNLDEPINLKAHRGPDLGPRQIEDAVVEILARSFRWLHECSKETLLALDDDSLNTYVREALQNAHAATTPKSIQHPNVRNVSGRSCVMLTSAAKRTATGLVKYSSSPDDGSTANNGSAERRAGTCPDNLSNNYESPPDHFSVQPTTQATETHTTESLVPAPRTRGGASSPATRNTGTQQMDKASTGHKILGNSGTSIAVQKCSPDATTAEKQVIGGNSTDTLAGHQLSIPSGTKDAASESLDTLQFETGLLKEMLENNPGSFQGAVWFCHDATSLVVSPSQRPLSSSSNRPFRGDAFGALLSPKTPCQQTTDFQTSNAGPDNDAGQSCAIVKEAKSFFTPSITSTVIAIAVNEAPPDIAYPAKSHTQIGTIGDGFASLSTPGVAIEPLHSADFGALELYRSNVSPICDDFVSGGNISTVNSSALSREVQHELVPGILNRRLESLPSEGLASSKPDQPIYTTIESETLGQPVGLSPPISQNQQLLAQNYRGHQRCYSSCFKLPYTPHPPQVLQATENMFYATRLYFEDICPKMTFDDQGILVKEGTIITNDLCNDFDSYCFTATMLFERKEYSEFAGCLSKACALVKSILQAQHPRSLTCFFEVLLHLIQNGLLDVAITLCRFINAMSAEVIGDRQPWGRICRLLGELDSDSLYSDVVEVWKCIADTFDNKLGTSSRLAVSVRLDYVKRVHGATNIFEEERKLKELLKCVKSPSKLRVMLNLAHNLNRQGRHDDAETMARKIQHNLQECSKGKRVVEKIECLKVMAHCQFNLGNPAAEHTMKEAIRMIEDQWGSQHCWLLEFTTVLRGWYKHWGREEDACKLVEDLGLVDSVRDV